MRCDICGRLEGREDHHRQIHFVHDHIDLLDNTVVLSGTANRLFSRPPPWKFSPWIQQHLKETWETYEIPD